MVGRIFQLSRSQGGVPKLPVREAHIGLLGVDGDRQKNLDIHGGPERALCLYSLEVICALQAEGHPIFPGSAGENVTLSGLEWSRMCAGVQLRLGDDVLVEVTRDTTPCKAIKASFSDLVFTRISHEKHPGWSRFYAKVLHAGSVRIGQAARVV